MVKKRAQMRMSAAERRVRACAPGASTLREAVLHVVAELMHGVRCPPTDLTEFGQKLGVLEIIYESFPGSGELHTINNGYRIICSSDQSRPRQRFTVAHELAHVILERTGRNAPRKGNSVESVCDMLAAECLMPTLVFEPLLPSRLTLDDIAKLADTFDTSITATAIRCAQLRSVCIFGVTGQRVTWGYGGVRPGAVIHLLDEVRDSVQAVMANETPAERVYFYVNGSRGSYRRLDWTRLGKDSALFLLIEDNNTNEIGRAEWLK